MQNKFGNGEVITVTSPSGGTTTGVGVLIGSLFGLAVDTSNAGDTIAIETEGEFDHTSDTGTAWAVGDTLYWDNTNKRLTKTSSGNTKVGYCTNVKASGATTGRINLVPFAA